MDRPWLRRRLSAATPLPPPPAAAHARRCRRPPLQHLDPRSRQARRLAAAMGSKEKKHKKEKRRKEKKEKDKKRRRRDSSSDSSSGSSSDEEEYKRRKAAKLVGAGCGPAAMRHVGGAGCLSAQVLWCRLHRMRLPLALSNVVLHHALPPAAGQEGGAAPEEAQGDGRGLHRHRQPLRWVMLYSDAA